MNITNAFLNELLNKHERIWFELSPGEEQEFLSFARARGGHWLNGREICPETDSCNLHVSLHRDGAVANVAWFVWFHSDHSSVKKLVFRDFLDGRDKTPDSRPVTPLPI